MGVRPSPPGGRDSPWLLRTPTRGNVPRSPVAGHVSACSGRPACRRRGRSLAAALCPSDTILGGLPTPRAWHTLGPAARLARAQGPATCPPGRLAPPVSIPHCSAYGDQTRALPSWAPCRGPCHHRPGSLCRSPGQAARPGSPRTPLSSARSTRHLPVSVRLFQMGTWRVAKFRLRWTLAGSSFVSLGWAPQQVPETWHRRCPSTGAGLSGVGPPSHPTGGADSPAAPHRQPRLALPPPPPRVGGGGLRWRRAQGLAHPGGCAHGAATYLSRPPAHLLLDCLFFLDLREFFKHSGRRSFVRGFHTFWQFIRSAEVFILAKLNSSIFSRTGNAILHWETLAHPQASVRSCRTFWKV